MKRKQSTPPRSLKKAGREAKNNNVVLVVSLYFSESMQEQTKEQTPSKAIRQFK